MSPDQTNSDPVVLLVSDSNDAEMGMCLDRLSLAGIRVDRAASVYAAAAELATRRDIRHVLLDIRSLDDKEMAIHRLLRRSFPDTGLIVPILDGTAERAATYGPGIRPTPIDSAMADLLEAYGRDGDAPVVEPPGVSPPPGEELPAVGDETEPETFGADDDTDVAAKGDVDASASTRVSDEDADRPDATTLPPHATPSPEDADAEQPEPPGDTAVLADDASRPPEEDPLAPAEPNEASSPFDRAPVTTEQAEELAYDVAPDASVSEESSREAYQSVRDRLAAELGRSAQRTPPRRRPPGADDRELDAPVQQHPDNPASMLSPEEMDALMTNHEEEPGDQQSEGGGA